MQRPDLLLPLHKILHEETLQGSSAMRKEVWDVVRHIDENSDLRTAVMLAGSNKLSSLYGACMLIKSLHPELFE